jgi:PUA-domain protein
MIMSNVHVSSMADILIRRRKRMRSKEIKVFSSDLEEILGVPVFKENDPVDMAESSEFNVLFVGNDILGIVYDGKPFLTVRGLMKYRPEKKFVTIDMGAVPFITNGADCMGPGITDADPSISEGDLVWIRDSKNKVPLAVGISERSGAELAEKKPGKAIKSLHYVGDKLWKTGE